MTGKVVANKEALIDMIGYEPEPSEWLLIDQSRITAFADTTMDHQFIHVDPEKAAKTPFGGTIAHGFLSLSLIGYFGQSFSVTVKDMKMGLNYGFDKIRFLAPVKVDSKIRGRGKIKGVEEKSPGQFLVTYEVVIEIEDEETPALIANWLLMLVL